MNPTTYIGADDAEAIRQAQDTPALDAIRRAVEKRRDVLRNGAETTPDKARDYALESAGCRFVLGIIEEAIKWATHNAAKEQPT